MQQPSFAHPAQPGQFRLARGDGAQALPRAAGRGQRAQRGVELGITRGRPVDDGDLLTRHDPARAAS